MFIIFASVYSALVYLLYPIVYDWGLFLALQKQQHDFSHFLIAIFYCVLVVIFASVLRLGIFSLFNCFLIFTTFIPFFMLMPYFAPGYLYSADALVFFFSSLMFTFIGLATGFGKGVGLSLAFNKRSFLCFLFIINVFSLGGLIFNFYGLLSFRAFYNIYEQRELYRGAMNVFSYILHWQFMVFSPVSLIFSMQVRSVSLFCLAVFGFLVVFIITGFKASFVVLMVVLFGFLTKGVWARVATLPSISLSLLLMFTASIALDYFLGIKAVSPYVVDRVLFAHGIQLLMIVEFFKDLPSAMWTNSFLRHFVDPIYDVDPFIYLGQAYFGREVRLNTNFVGDGFINLGLLGVFISTAFAAICLAICELVTMKKSFVVCVLLFVPHFVALLNGPIQVSLVTNGLLITVLILLIYPQASIYSNMHGVRGGR